MPEGTRAERELPTCRTPLRLRALFVLGELRDLLREVRGARALRRSRRSRT